MKFLVNVILISLILCCFQQVIGEVVNLVEFTNKTTSDYIVYTRYGEVSSEGGPIFVAESAGWVPVLILKAGEIGKVRVLLRDNEGFGVQVRMAPVMRDFPSFYLKSGIKTSGDCIDPWFVGPYAIDVALDESLLSDPFKNYDKVHRVRYCVYRDGKLTVEIYSDGIKFVDYHNMKVLDAEKVTIADLKGKEE